MARAKSPGGGCGRGWPVVRPSTPAPPGPPHQDPPPTPFTPFGEAAGPSPHPQRVRAAAVDPGRAHTKQMAATSGEVLSSGRGRYLGLTCAVLFLLGHVRACISKRKLEQEAKLEGQLLTL